MGIVYDYSINNLAEYIHIVESLDKDSYSTSLSPVLYRGEKENFYEFNNNQPIYNAAAFRIGPVEGYETGMKLPFQENLDSFRYEVWNEIDYDTRKNFLAYAQHHHIKTNLLDFSNNPLVGLFFAVEDLVNDTGYVYLHESPVLDITPLFQDSDETNILDIINTESKEILDKLVKYFWGFGGRHRWSLEKYFYLLCEDYYRLINDDENLVLNEERDEKIIIDMLDSIAMNDPNKRIMDHFDGFRRDGQKGLSYLVLLRGFSRLKKYRISSISSELLGIVPMIYKPVMNFKRGINQSGVFLYQSYIVSKGNALVAKKKLEPTTVIKVTNKENILKSLDKLNINSKFIYGDHTSIAEYIEKNI